MFWYFSKCWNICINKGISSSWNVSRFIQSLRSHHHLRWLKKSPHHLFESPAPAYLKLAKSILFLFFYNLITMFLFLSVSIAISPQRTNHLASSSQEVKKRAAGPGCPASGLMGLWWIHSVTQQCSFSLISRENPRLPFFLLKLKFQAMPS